jgi:16S rRNA C967 or C1407 C5-methylase (RsmB/RsmF family)
MMKLAYELFTDDDERDEFMDALERGDSKEQAIIVMEDRNEIKAFPRIKPLKWQPAYVERIEDTFKPSKHPLYTRGAYYSLDFSSVFSASAMLAMDIAPKRVLDLCSSPGGKAVFAYRTFKPELLLCNETMRKRAGTLIANLDRCKCTSAVVWSSDPSVYAKRYRECFDLVICDAPCSGQSLLAKGDESVGCFVPNMIDMNVGRQRRITGNAYHCLRPGGYLLYATCTFTPKENEKVIDWLLKTYEDLEAVEITHLIEFRSKFSEFPSYRLFPQQGLGAGAFVCLVRRKGEKTTETAPIKEIPAMWKYGDEVIQRRKPEVVEPVETEAQRAHRERPLSARQIVKKMAGGERSKGKLIVKKPRKRRK